MIKSFLTCLLAISFLLVAAQEPDMVYYNNIQNIKLFRSGDQLSYPIVSLGATDQLELHFDDREAGSKAYYYTWQLCNADWTPAMLNPVDYIRGFSQSRILTYRNSSLALTRYTHYQQSLPDKGSMPSRSGNYLLKVFLNGDPQNLVFTRRVLVVQEQASVSIRLQQTFNPQLFQTHQKLVFTVDLKGLNVMNVPQQVTVCALQNYRWDNKKSGLRPTFIRQNQLEFNNDQDAVFPAGKDWRWLDLRSFRLQSDRVDSAQYGNTSTTIFVKPDLERASRRFVYYRDLGGRYYNETLDGVNPYWQGDYATVYFSFRPPGGLQYTKDLYLFGEMTGYGSDPQAKLEFNKTTGLYETSVWLKQGYYDYVYALKNADGSFSTDLTEGSYWETANTYSILVYYRALGGRADELVSVGTIQSGLQSSQ
ncbi:MAG: DUF5103 domain-containing protein [Flavihumibacter sp.]